MANQDILDPEHGTPYDDPDLVQALLEAMGATRAEYDALTPAEQRQLQRDFIGGPPHWS